MSLTLWRTGWRVGVRVSKPGDREIRKLEEALARLGVNRPVPGRVRVTLRIWARYRHRAEIHRTWLTIWAWLAFGFILEVASQSIGDTQKPADDDPDWVTPVLDWVKDNMGLGYAVALVLPLLIVLVTTLVVLAGAFAMAAAGPLLAVFRVPGWGKRAIQPTSRAEPVLVIARAIEACADARSTGGDRHIQARLQVSRRLKDVARVVQRAHWTRGTVPLRSYRRTELKEHARQVVAVLRGIEYRLDVEPHAALRDLGDLLLTIAERYAEGRVGALLDEERLEGIEPVRTHEVLRLVATSVLTTAGGVGIALAGLPSGTEPYVLSAYGVLVLVLIYGRGVRHSVDLVDFFRGGGQR